METRAELFGKRTVKLEDIVSDRKGQEYSTWSDPAPLRTAQNMDDPRYLERDSERTKSGEVGAKQPKCAVWSSKDNVKREFQKAQVGTGDRFQKHHG